MRKLSLVFVCLILASLVSCATYKQAELHDSLVVGTSSNTLLAKLGPPLQVQKSVGGVEVWEYMVDSSVFTNAIKVYYYIKDGKVIKKSQDMQNIN